MSYDAFSSLVLVLVGVALITFRRPLSRLQLIALTGVEHVRTDPKNYLTRQR